MSNMNRLYNSKNGYQGKYKRVLCVCSAGLLRSPTAAMVLSQEPYNFNTRAAGLDASFALIPVDNVLIEWADEVVCMSTTQADELTKMGAKNLKCLDIKDDYAYRDEKLIQLIKERYDAI